MKAGENIKDLVEDSAGDPVCISVGKSVKAPVWGLVLRSIEFVICDSSEDSVWNLIMSSIKNRLKK